MSTPPYLALPDDAVRRDIPVARGTRAAISLEARGDARGTVVCVPGFTGSKEDFIGILAPLSARGWNVVAFDQLGQFQSAGPDSPADYDIDALARDVSDIVTHAAARGPVHVVGHSLGGLVARRAAILRAGEGEGATIGAGATGMESLTLMCSGPGALPNSRGDALPALIQALPQTPLADVWEAKEALDRAAGGQLPAPEVHAFLRARFCANSPWGLRTMAEILINEPDRTAALAASGLAVHVMHGEHDDAWPLDDQAEMARRLGTTSRVVAGAAHSPAAELPLDTAVVLDSLWSS